VEFSIFSGAEEVAIKNVSWLVIQDGHEEA